MSRKIVFCAIVVSVLVTGILGEWPKSLGPIKVDDEASCIDFFNQLIETKHMGDPTMNLNSFDPMDINKLTGVRQPKGHPISLECDFENVRIYGYKNFRAVQCSGFGKNAEGIQELHFQGPNATLVGDYTCNGNINDLPVQGAGQVNLTKGDVLLTVTIYSGSIVKDGKTYSFVKDLKMDFQAKPIKFTFTNLYVGNEELSNNLSKAMDDFAPEVYAELKQSLMPSYEERHKEIYGQMISTVPYSEIVEGGMQ